MSKTALLAPSKAKKKGTYSLSLWVAILWMVFFTLVAWLYPVLTGNPGLALNPEKAYLPPFTEAAHLLGTDQLGRDLLKYLMLACHTAWFLTFPPLLSATAFGVLAGSAAGFYGNKGLYLPAGKALLAAVWLAMLLYFMPMVHWEGLALKEKTSFFHYFIWPVYLACGVVGLLVIKKLSLNFNKKSWRVPLDTIVSKAIEIWSTLPKLLLLLLLSTLATPSLFTLMAWIAVSYWVLPARLSRNKVEEIKNRPFVESAVASGIPTGSLLQHHILPFLLNPVVTNFCFSASGLLGIGSTLAFIGIGLPPETPSWGKMLAVSRFSVDAWWLLAFPAILLLFSILSLQTLGQKLSSKEK